MALAWSERRRLGAALAGGAIWLAGSLAVPGLTGLIVDRLEAGDMGAVLRWSGLLALAGVVSAVGLGANEYLLTAGGRHAEAALRERLAVRLLELDVGFHERFSAGQLLGRLNADLQQVERLLEALPEALIALAFVLAVVPILVATDAEVAAAGLAAFPALAVLAWRFKSVSYPSALGLQRRLSALSSVVEDSLSGIRVVKGLGAESAQVARLASTAGDVYDRAVQWARLRAAFLPAWELVPALGIAAVLWFGGRRVMSGELTLGALVAINGYLLLLVWPCARVGSTISLAQRAVAAATRAAEILDARPAIADPAQPRTLPPGGGEVRLEGVTFGRGCGPPLLDGIDLVVPAGGSVGLVGPSGAGKTTLVELIARLRDPVRGRVLLDGVDLRELRLGELRRAVAVVFQEPLLFRHTVRHNIAIGSPGCDDAAVRRAARLAGAHEFVERLPRGYDTHIGERGFSLSGGQRQRLALARAIVARPRLLVLDDPTSAVDAPTELALLGGLREAMEGRTTIVVTHRPAVLSLVDAVATLQEGRLRAVPRPREPAA